MSLEVLVDNFIDYIRFERLLSRNTVQSYKRDINKYCSYLKNRKIDDPQKLSHEEIINFMESLFKNQTDTSVSRILSTIRSFYRYLIMNNKIKTNPFAGISNPKTPRKDIEILDKNEMSDFLDRIPASTSFQLRDRAMFELLYSCGLRVSEITGLMFSNIDLDENLIRFIGKGGKERITPIGQTAMSYLLKYLNHSRFNLESEQKNKYVFLNKMGGPITRQGFWKILKQYSKKFNFEKNLYPHIFRHSFATHMLEQGADLRTVQELLGHSSISTTEIYTNLNKKHLKETYFKYHPRDKKSI